MLIVRSVEGEPNKWHQKEMNSVSTLLFKVNEIRIAFPENSDPKELRNRPKLLQKVKANKEEESKSL